jgi:hypothetical protein
MLPSAIPSEMMSWPRACAIFGPRSRAPIRSDCGSISYVLSVNVVMPVCVKRSACGPSTTRIVTSSSSITPGSAVAIGAHFAGRSRRTSPFFSARPS